MKVKRLALVIGLEKYEDDAIQSVQFAENDAKCFQEWLTENELAPCDVVFLCNCQATKTRIEVELRTLVSSASSDNDEIILFYAGHGVAIDGRNYITCYDTMLKDLTHSCIALQFIIDTLRSGLSKRMILFLDSCHSTLKINESMRCLINKMNDEELKSFFAEAKYDVGFASCGYEESSYSSKRLGHGIWTYCLLQALRGKVPKAVQREKFVTSSSLQNYLSSEVPKLVKEEHGTSILQTPKIFGDFSREFVICDLEPFFLKKATKRQFVNIKGEALELLGYRRDKIRFLAGFRKGHRVPTFVNASTRSFVEKISNENFEKDVNYFYNSLKNNFKYKKNEIKVDKDSVSALISLKDFDFCIDYCQDEEMPDHYLVKYRIDKIGRIDALLDNGLQAIMSGCFNEIALPIKKSINLETLIEEIEGRDEKLGINYPSDYSWVELDRGHRNWKIKIEISKISIKSSSLEAPLEIINYLRDAENDIINYSLIF